MANQNTKPYWANEVYLEEITKAYNWYSQYQNGEAWKGLTQWKGVTGFESKEDYLQLLTKLKSMIDKVTLEIKVTNQMEENNKKFNQSLEISI